MIKATTSTGFEFELDEEVISDWDTVELFSEISDDNPFVVVKLVKKLLGTKQYNALKRHCSDGGLLAKPNSERMFQEIHEILATDVPKK